MPFRLVSMHTINSHQDEKISQICHVVYSTLLGEPARHQKRMSELGEALAAYPPHLLARVHTELTEVQDDLANDFVIMLSDPAIDPVSVEEYLTFRPYVRKNKKLHLIRKMIHSLHSYPQLPAINNYAEAPEHTKTQISSLLRVVDLLLHACATRYKYDYPLILDKGKVMLEGDSLIRLVITHPEKADLIAKTIISRDIKDVTLIRSIITIDAPSIGEGTL